MSNTMKRISAQELKALLANGSGAAILDVRTPVEFGALHIPGSYNVPLDLLPEHAHDVTRNLARQIVLVCQSGNRATQAQQCLVDIDIEGASVLVGGIAAYEKAGGEVVRGSRRWAMDRQVRMAAGALVLAGFLAGKIINPKLGYLPAAVGAGLVFSAATNSCAMAGALSRMPWNRVRPVAGSNPLADTPNAGQLLAGNTK
ncbi:rhodanese-like domain-containing protein [Glutamicibacter sp. MNS18]|uniref:rhodanese-like domain-containing protein n=1 Tax=Glutamicibacter sp. MNS18 TaxID=2989817 RepID=UPI002236B369|nr:rhodanese-like domain-containing protein [Glutamicibacter sp. MNS18]MCW4466064.1 rhodanese-like domain-containing protein [Glutamicibacter sp. MNS18]